MNRKTFFKRLFGAAAVAVVAPRILAQEEVPVDGYSTPRPMYPPGIKNPDDFTIYEYKMDPAEVVERFENELTHEQKVMLGLVKKYEGMSLVEFLGTFNK